MESSIEPFAAAQAIRSARHSGNAIDAEAIARSLLGTGAATIDLLLEAGQYYSALGDNDRALSLTGEAKSLCQTEQDSVRIANLRVYYLVRSKRFNDARLEIQNVVDRHRIADPALAFGETLGIIVMKEERAAAQDGWAAYWEQRQHFVYLHVCKQLIKAVAASARTAVDIGSNRTPTLEFFPERIRRYSVDPTAPYEAQGIVSVRKLFQDWVSPEPIDVGTCFQVIEHVPQPEAFCRAILDTCEVSLISVPYREKPGANPGHINSMIDEATIHRWFGREPNYKYIATELSGEQRIICLFDRMTTMPFAGMHTESPDALRYRFRWSLEGSGIRSVVHSA